MMTTSSISAVLLLVAATIVSATSAATGVAKDAGQVGIYVATTGSDATGDGSIVHPFQTPTRARDEIRAMKAKGPLPSGGITVTLRQGDYGPAADEGSSSQGILSLTSEDSGTEDSPIVYQAYPGEHVRLVGGVKVPPTLFAADPSRPGVMKADIASLNITYGEQTAGTLGQCTNNKAELFFDNEPAVLARWPNILPNGLWNWTNIADANGGLNFTYAGDRPSRWIHEADPWVHGYWSFGWADNYVKISEIDPSKNTIVADPKYPPVYGFKPKARFYGVNLLSELDVPNEYYIDKVNQILYFYPPYSINSTSDIIITTLDTVISVGSTTTTGSTPNVASPPSRYAEIPQFPDGVWPSPIDESTENIADSPVVEFITFQNLNLNFARGVNLKASGVNHLNVLNCNLDNAGSSSLGISNANNSKVSGCSAGYAGCKAMYMEGGNIPLLTPGNNSMTNNVVHDYARVCRTYQPGIAFGGMGNEYNNNEMYNAPHQGMTGGGNDNIFDGNYFHDLCYEVSDSGAWYAGRSWTHRGSIIKNNVFKHIRALEKTTLGYPSVQAVYFDDQLSAHITVNNTFIDCQMGILLGGGRHHEIYNNKFSKCDTGISVDDRGLTWQTAYCKPPGGHFFDDLNSVHYQQPPWSTHYPVIVNISTEYPCTPVYNTIYDNTYCDGAKFLSVNEAQLEAWHSKAYNNTPVHC